MKNLNHKISKRKVEKFIRSYFLMLALIAGSTMFFAGCGDQSQKTNKDVWNSDLDQYGGWKDKQFEATGFFRTEHDGKRWWLVTPEGHPFISFGLNHFHASFWNQPANSEHWTKEFGAHEPLDETWINGFRNYALKICQDLGFNALGIHNDIKYLTDSKQGAILPYIRRYEPVVLSHWTYPKADRYHDVFAPEFIVHCDSIARKQAYPFKDDPMLIGYSMSDAPVLTDLAVKNRPPGATTWPRVLRNLAANSPGKQAYVEMVRNNYKDIAAFNQDYNTSFDSWEDLTATKSWRPETDYNNQSELDDNAAFLRLCIEECYKVALTALRKYDPDHMFLGNKIGFGEENIARQMEIVAPLVDIINYGNYGRLATQIEFLDQWTDKVNKPFLNADGSLAMRSEMVPNPISRPGTVTDDPVQYATWTRELAEGLFARPDVVGWDLCGSMETWKTAPGQEKKQHQGIMDPFGKMHPGIDVVIKDVSSRLYLIASKQDPDAGKQ